MTRSRVLCLPDSWRTTGDGSAATGFTACTVPAASVRAHVRLRLVLRRSPSGRTQPVVASEVPPQEAGQMTSFCRPKPPHGSGQIASARPSCVAVPCRATFSEAAPVSQRPMYQCPLCNPRSWSQPDPMLKHVQRFHLAADEFPPQSFLDAYTRRVCYVCRLLVPLSRACRRCERF